MPFLFPTTSRLFIAPPSTTARPATNLKAPATTHTSFTTSTPTTSLTPPMTLLPHRSILQGLLEPVHERILNQPVLLTCPSCAFIEIYPLDCIPACSRCLERFKRREKMERRHSKELTSFPSLLEEHSEIKARQERDGGFGMWEKVFGLGSKRDKRRTSGSSRESTSTARS
jgi:hypothetical protein